MGQLLILALAALIAGGKWRQCGRPRRELQQLPVECQHEHWRARGV